MPSTIAGVPVPDDLWSSWRRWFAPDRQPFDLSGLGGETRDLLPAPSRVQSPEVRDTFYCYHPDFTELGADEFATLPREVRAALARTRAHPGRPTRHGEEVRRMAREQTGGGPFVWWPDLLALAGDEPISRFVGHGLAASIHREVPARTWRLVDGLLPRARELAGTFPGGSGANCFGTVLEAAGEVLADDWVQQETFDAWLVRAATRLSRRPLDDRAGVVLVWRTESGLATRAAVTLGNGYALTKPSQCWYGPRLVWTVRQTISHARTPGSRLERWQI